MLKNTGGEQSILAVKGLTGLQSLGKSLYINFKFVIGHSVSFPV
jgi:hypothetical protein